MRVLIAGCGYVGSALAVRLTEDGARAWGLRRDPSGLPHGVQPVAADLLDPGLEEWIPRTDAVVYAASPDESSDEAYRRTYVSGLENLLRALRSRGADGARVILVSSTSVYGDQDGREVDEDTPVAPEDFRGSRVVEGEKILGDTWGDGVILRLGGIYGPGRTRLLERVRAGTARCPAPPTVWSNRIHVEDAAGALHHLLGVEDPDRVYIGVDREPVSICTVYRYVAELLGAPEPEVEPESGRRRGNKRCSSRRLVESGYAFRYPSFREGYRQVVAGLSG
jgi:nucleoside-diphosphate-sugar epimerase